MFLETLVTATLAAAQFAAGWSLDAAAIRGEFRRDLLAAGIVLLILAIAWAWQEWEMRRQASALGWLGLSLLIIAGVAGAMLVATGLL